MYVRVCLSSALCHADTCYVVDTHSCTPMLHILVCTCSRRTPARIQGGSNITPIVDGAPTFLTCHEQQVQQECSSIVAADCSIAYNILVYSTVLVQYAIIRGCKYCCDSSCGHLRLTALLVGDNGGGGGHRTSVEGGCVWCDYFDKTSTLDITTYNDE